MHFAKSVQKKNSSRANGLTRCGSIEQFRAHWKSCLSAASWLCSPFCTVRFDETFFVNNFAEKLPIIHKTFNQFGFMPSISSDLAQSVQLIRTFYRKNRKFSSTYPCRMYTFTLVAEVKRTSLAMAIHVYSSRSALMGLFADIRRRFDTTMWCSRPGYPMHVKSVRSHGALCYLEYLWGDSIQCRWIPAIRNDSARRALHRNCFALELFCMSGQMVFFFILDKSHATSEPKFFSWLSKVGSFKTPTRLDLAVISKLLLLFVI